MPPTTRYRTIASSSQAEFGPEGAANGDRFALGPGSAWKGQSGEAGWWWQVRFDEPREIGAILQINGEHPTVFRNAPSRYGWQGSLDGRRWRALEGTETERERRSFRLHRLPAAARVQYLRLNIQAADGDFPTLREVEFYPQPDSAVRFDDWMVVVSTVEHNTLPGPGQDFIPLARECPGWEHLQAQQVWLDTFDEAFVSAEPRPLCAFISGNFKDWCEVPREPWRGTQEVLQHRNIPMWAACGGAQALAILTEAGVDHEWDCPHCRDPHNPKLPIYTHISHNGETPCGDYSACEYERGEYNVRQLLQDPAFAGLPQEFSIMESHCGQIAWPPEGWMLAVTAGTDAKTKTQCIRVKDRYIYAAQFHIEMAGTPENSRQIMSNFLSLAKQWGGYNPEGAMVPTPHAWESPTGC
jgi:hypothetical protein